MSSQWKPHNPGDLESSSVSSVSEYVWWAIQRVSLALPPTCLRKLAMTRKWSAYGTWEQIPREPDIAASVELVSRVRVRRKGRVDGEMATEPRSRRGTLALGCAGSMFKGTHPADGIDRRGPSKA